MKDPHEKRWSASIVSQNLMMKDYIYLVRTFDRQTSSCLGPRLLCQYFHVHFTSPSCAASHTSLFTANKSRRTNRTRTEHTSLNLFSSNWFKINCFALASCSCLKASRLCRQRKVVVGIFITSLHAQSTPALHSPLQSISYTVARRIPGLFKEAKQMSSRTHIFTLHRPPDMYNALTDARDRLLLQLVMNY